MKLKLNLLRVILALVLWTSAKGAFAQSVATFDVLHPHHMTGIKVFRHGVLEGNEWRLSFSRSRTESLGGVAIDIPDYHSMYYYDLNLAKELGEEVYFWSSEGLNIFNQKSFEMKEYKLKGLPEKYDRWDVSQSQDPVTGFVYLNARAPKDKMICVVFDPAKGKIVRQVKGAWIYATSEMNYQLEPGFIWSVIDKKSGKKINSSLKVTDNGDAKASSIPDLFRVKMVWLPGQQVLAFLYEHQPFLFRLEKGEVSRISYGGPPVVSFEVRGEDVDQDGYFALGRTSYSKTFFVRCTLNDPAEWVVDEFDIFLPESGCKRNSHTYQEWYDHNNNQWLARGYDGACFNTHLPQIEKNRLNNATIQEQRNAKALELAAANVDDKEWGIERHPEREGYLLPKRSTKRLTIESSCMVSHGIFSNEKTNTLYMFYDSLIYVYDKNERKLRHTYGYPNGRTTKVSRIADDRFVFVNDKNEVYVYDMSSARCIRALSLYWNYGVTVVGERAALIAVDHGSGRHLTINLNTGAVVRTGQLKNFAGGARLLTASPSLEAIYFLSNSDDMYKYHAVTGERIFKRDAWTRPITMIATYPTDKFIYTIIDHPHSRQSWDGDYVRHMPQNPVERCTKSSVFFYPHRGSGNVFSLNGLKDFPGVGYLELVPSIKESGVTFLDNHGFSSDDRYYYFASVAAGQFVVYAYDIQGEVLSDWFVLEGDKSQSPALSFLKGRDLYYDGEAERDAEWDAKMEAHRLEALREREAYNEWLSNFLAAEKAAERKAIEDRAKAAADAALAEAADVQTKMESGYYQDGVATFEAESPSGTIAVITANVKFENVQEKDLLLNRYNWVKKIVSYDIQRFYFKNNPKNVMSASSSDHVEKCTIIMDSSSWEGECVYLHDYQYRLLSYTMRVYD